VSFKRFVFLFTMLAVFTMAVRVSVDSDTWWHLRAGKTIVEQRAVLERDPFSLTRQGESWEYPGWLAEIALYAAYLGLGYAGLNLLTALAVTLAFLLLWRTLEGRLLLRSALILLAAATSAVYWSARPQIFSFTLTAAFLLILERERVSTTKWLWLLPPLMALWVNLHGGFALGFILLVLYLGSWLLVFGLDWLRSRAPLSELWAQYRVRILRLVLVGLLAAVFTGINPGGFKMLAYPFKTVSIGVLGAYIQEWQSPDFHQAQVLPFMGMMLLSLAALAATRREVTPLDLLLLGCFNAMALLAARNIAVYALVATPILCRHLDTAADDLGLELKESRQVRERVGRRVNLALFIVLLLAAVVKIMIPLATATNEAAIRRTFPAAAVGYLQAGELPGPLFNSYNWGAYLLWELYPRYLSFVDGRTDLFDDEVLQAYLHAWRGDADWTLVLDEWGIATVLIEPDAPLAYRLDCDPAWRLAYEDRQAVIYTRGDGPAGSGELKPPGDGSVE